MKRTLGLRNASVATPLGFGMVPELHLYNCAPPNPIVSFDRSGKFGYLVVYIAIAVGAAAVAWELWQYSRAAEACKQMCDARSEAGLWPPGDTRYYHDCMKPGTNLATDGPISEISTGLGLGMTPAGGDE